MALNMKPVVIHRSQVNEFLQYLAKGKDSKNQNSFNTKPASK